MTHQRKRILLVSNTGQVGAELWRSLQSLGDVITVDRDHPTYPVDLADHSQLRHAVRDVAPDIIVNAAAYTAVDNAEQDEALAMAINGTAPGILAEEAKALDALLVHYSTDYVYNGKHVDKPYVETDFCDPRSVYGKTKLAGDEAIQGIGCKHLIFRTSWVYGRYGNNFLLTMLRLGQERSELSIVADQIGAPTWSRLISDATTQVLVQLQSALCPHSIEDLSGIYHLTCGGQTSWCDFAKAIVSHLPNPPSVFPIRTEEYPAPAPRPAYSVLSNDKLAETFGVRLPDWDVALDVCLSREQAKSIFR
ncbi:dTDP-4-dehydrorhamnose reductase [Candidatus Venteria ishoeyi]|uniref:dTDP-4-dehydrorhamnose reductase n=1 Tax=Candidatus Venteria ishoeyi TaxID=1899563 RepID=A0A1H6FCG6_9GAMM|nr:dTDP-4-dehydrorhamnose reductase [Candidatus Venteria ishoeyi]MDM8544985.1 dTDP-4-dehydrorhamnose reductase [Candidatus Venteria ishoeyi]SEH07757.1 dTDP-4-dehydrorhamnose reductase [Candidatus Venteria ishoeyi]